MCFHYMCDDKRTALYNEVWKEPIDIVAKRHNLSDYKLRNCCKTLCIPIPPRGYWIKVRAGEKPPKSSLPKVTGELKKYIHNYIIKYRCNLNELSDEELISGEELYLFNDDTKKYIIEKCSNIKVKNQLRNTHKLIEEHKELRKVRKKNEKDSFIKQLLGEQTYQNVSISSANTFILPIDVSRENLNRAYKILDALIKTIEDLEGHVLTVTKDGHDIGYFNLLRRVRFYFTITERKKTMKDSYKSKLIFTMKPESFIYYNKGETMVYEDEKDKPLDEQLSKIIYEMIVVAEQLYIQDIIKEREEERAEQEKRRLRNLEKMREGQLEEIKLLERASLDWEKANKIRSFIIAFEQNIDTLPNDYKKSKYREWLKWAKDKADWLDPLVEKEDELLGKSKTIFEEIDIKI